MKAPTALIKSAAALGLLKRSTAAEADVSAITTAIATLDLDDQTDARRENELREPAVAERVQNVKGPASVELAELRLRRAARVQDRADLVAALSKARAVLEEAQKEEAAAALTVEATEAAAAYADRSQAAIEVTAAAMAALAESVTAWARWQAAADALHKLNMPIPPTQGLSLPNILLAAEKLAHERDGRLCFNPAHARPQVPVPVVRTNS